jgi:hypothetical protein
MHMRIGETSAAPHRRVHRHGLGAGSISRNQIQPFDMEFAAVGRQLVVSIADKTRLARF